MPQFLAWGCECESFYFEFVALGHKIKIGDQMRNPSVMVLKLR